MGLPRKCSRRLPRMLPRTFLLRCCILLCCMIPYFCFFSVSCCTFVFLPRTYTRRCCFIVCTLFVCSVQVHCVNPADPNNLYSFCLLMLVHPTRVRDAYYNMVVSFDFIQMSKVASALLSGKYSAVLPPGVTLN